MRWVTSRCVEKKSLRRRRDPSDRRGSFLWDSCHEEVNPLVTVKASDLQHRSRRCSVLITIVIVVLFFECCSCSRLSVRDAWPRYRDNNKRAVAQRAAKIAQKFYHPRLSQLEWVYRKPHPYGGKLQHSEHHAATVCRWQDRHHLNDQVSRFERKDTVLLQGEHLRVVQQ